jgi:pyrroline-5-carboxylate reductase
MAAEAIKDRIGFIGAGQMARAMAAGFVRAGLVQGSQVSASDPMLGSRDAFAAETTGAKVTGDNRQVAANSDILFLAVKPQQLSSVLEGLKAELGKRHLVISIAAGVRLSKLAQSLSSGIRLVRVMPNTPCLVGETASGYSLGEHATAADASLVERLLSAVGRAYQVDEKLLDAVTGLSGSGPAYVYLMIEALSDGGVRMGLPRDVATALAAQTVLGSAKMVLETGDHPAILKDRVASPGGTTIAGLQALEAGGLRAALIAAVEAATRRSIELGV